MEGKVIVWFDEVDKNSLALVGGKGANLGEMTKAGIPVPEGFIVTADAYFYFLKSSGLIEKIRELLEPLDPNDSTRLQEVSSKIKRLIMETNIPPEIVSEIKGAYRRLGGLVAVRSSATAEDLPEASFAGQQRTFLNVEGEDEVVAAVQGCWASLFEARAIFYRHQHGFEHLKVKLAVPVQRMVQSDASGVMFTVDPVTNEDRIAIEAVYGLGEALVSGEITPDLYAVDKKDFRILDKNVVKQEWKVVRNPEWGGVLGEENIKVMIPPSVGGVQKISDEDIIALAKLGKRIEELYNFPQDIEWAKEGERLYIVQTRPVTTIGKERVVGKRVEKAKVILVGTPASPGIGSGPIRIVLKTSQISDVCEGDVLVAEMTTPDFVPAMRRSSAIVTDRGGRTCHAAIVSRELGIPCVVGTGSATSVLRNGQEITVDGSEGKVYEGRVMIEERKVAPQIRLGAKIKTMTKVYVNLAEPDLAENVASRNVDGVGLLRAEFMMAQIGDHPRYMLEQGRGEEFIRKLADGLFIFARAFYPRPVVYRTNDFKTNEYRNLRGGEKYEGVEENPMIGYRGASRYIRETDVLRLEIEAIKRVRGEFKNLWVMIPFVRTPKELYGVKRIFEEEGLKRSEDFKLWMMAEIPSNALILDKFIDVGIDGISIGSNDLTQLILGIDRDNPLLIEEFDERDEAVLLALEMLIKTASRRGVTSSICGQAPSVYPEIVEKLVEWGITSISVNPDAIEGVREIIAAVEEKLGIKQVGFSS